MADFNVGPVFLGSLPPAVSPFGPRCVPPLGPFGAGCVVFPPALVGPGAPAFPSSGDGCDPRPPSRGGGGPCVGGPCVPSPPLGGWSGGGTPEGGGPHRPGPLPSDGKRPSHGNKTSFSRVTVGGNMMPGNIKNRWVSARKT